MRILILIHEMAPTPPFLYLHKLNELVSVRAYVQKLRDLKWLWNVQMRGVNASAESKGLKKCGRGGIVYLHILRGLARIGAARVIDNDSRELYHSPGRLSTGK